MSVFAGKTLEFSLAGLLRVLCLFKETPKNAAKMAYFKKALLSAVR
jgi:hypothetical protein